MRTTNTAQKDRGRESLLGAWRLVAWEVTEADGTVSHPLGEAVEGQLIYDGGGRVSAQLVRADRPDATAGEEWRQASAEEMTRSRPGYFGYFGTFTVDTGTGTETETETETGVGTGTAAGSGTVTHHVESGSFPGLARTEQVREFRVDGGQLTLEAHTAWGAVRIVWERFG